MSGEGYDLMVGTHLTSEHTDRADKELLRYLIWRWGLEGIRYDITKGPILRRERDMARIGDMEPS